MKSILLAITILTLASFMFLPVYGTNTPPLNLPMVGSDWAVLNLITQPNGNFKISTSAASTIPTGGVYFPFMNAGSSTSSPTYTSEFTISFPLSLTTRDTITATIKIPTTCPITGTSPCPTTTFVGNPNGNACTPTTQTVRLFFQSTNTNSFETHFWWSNLAHYTIITGGTDGSTVLIGPVPLNGADWSDFFGHFGNVSPYSTGFADAIGDIKNIGLSFGSGCFFANGVGVDTATGAATFQLLSYYIS